MMPYGCPSCTVNSSTYCIWIQYVLLLTVEHLDTRCDKKAVLSQRWPRNAPYTLGALKIFGTPWLRPRLLFPTFFQGLLFRSTLWMFLQNLKSVALSIPPIIGGTPKIWTVPGYALAPFSRKFLIGFYSDWPYKCTRQICSPNLYPVPR